MIDIRHRLNDFLLNYGGHIGYSVRKSERRKGYATEMLSLALKECIKLNIDKVLITCDKNNLASAKTILNNMRRPLDEVPSVVPLIKGNECGLVGGFLDEQYFKSLGSLVCRK